MNLKKQRKWDRYFFAKPEILTKKSVQASQFNCLRLLQQINASELDFKNLENVIKNDVSLSYRLLRYINSAFFSWRVEITSIKQAIVLLGESEFKKWATLIAMSGMADEKPMELLVTALIRARFLEKSAPYLNMKNESEDLFLMGLFSLLDAVMDKTFEEVLSDVPIGEKIANALLSKEGQYYNILKAVKCFECGDWNGFFVLTGSYDFPEDKLPEIHLAAVEWAQESMEQMPK